MDTERTRKETTEMKDIYQRARCKEGFCRRDVKNKTARARVKAETRKAISKA